MENAVIDISLYYYRIYMLNFKKMRLKITVFIFVPFYPFWTFLKVKFWKILSYWVSSLNEITDQISYSLIPSVARRWWINQLVRTCPFIYIYRLVSSKSNMLYRKWRAKCSVFVKCFQMSLKNTTNMQYFLIRGKGG